jgi:O-antigen ligase
VNILGLLNIGLVIFAFLYFVLVVHKAPYDLIINFFLLFLVAEIFSLLIAVDKISALRGLMMTGSFLAIYMIIVYVFRSPQKLYLLRSAIVFSTIIPLLMGIYQVLTDTGNTVISPGLNRIMGTLFHPSALGMYLVVIWPLIILQITSTKSRNQRILYWFLLLVVTLMIGLTFTRIAWIGLAISIIGTTFIYRKFKLGLAFLLIFLLTGVFFSSVIIDRFGDAIILSGSRLSFTPFGSVAWRIEQWKLALELWAKHPIFGVGLWNFPLYDRWQSTPHNEFLRIGAELGTFGFVSYIILLTTILGWFTMMYLRKPTHSYTAKGVGTVILVILNYILFSTTDNPLGLPEVSWYVWAIIAMGVVIVRLPHVILQDKSHTEIVG